LRTEFPYSTAEQLATIQQMITNYLRLPFAGDTLPGSLLEAIIGKVHNAEVLKTYDFADVVKRGEIGWQVKSTKSKTPVTWMRAKIPEKQELIAASQQDTIGKQNLGNAIIAYCNAHVAESLNHYGLEQIGYARLVLFPKGHIMYFERLLLSAEQPVLFQPTDYHWDWSPPKRTKGKEQLPAFVGRLHETGDKHFAWHGLGENQLHFSGESSWWLPEEDGHRIDFSAPTSAQRVDFETIADWLAQLPLIEAEASSDSPIR